jgi:D-alanine-D-alanine ligase-like ATP-grasp enzyme/UDP-N-acetylmuramyl pentapeptide synthase
MISEPMPNLGEPVLATQGNYNSRVDALALLANLHPNHVAAIVEVAQSALWMKRGPVTRLLCPTISVITEIGLSQSDRNVSSVEDTARWKSRVFDGLTGSAIAVIGEHFPYFDKVQQKAAKQAHQILVFGESRNAHIRILKTENILDQNILKNKLTLGTPQGQLTFLLPLASLGMIRNAAAALTVMLAMEKDLAEAASALEVFESNPGCLRYEHLRLRHGDVTLIDDSHNATVSSMLNAFKVLSEASASAQGRKIAVLGRMIHLGDLAQPLHEDLAEPLIKTGVELVITQGSEMRFLRAKLPDRLLGPHCDRATDVALHLQERANSGDVILIKGSRRDSDFGDVIRLLKADTTPSAKTPKSLHTHQTDKPRTAKIDLLMRAALRRNLQVVKHPAGYVELIPQGLESGPIFRRHSPNHSTLATTITADKGRTKALLQINGLPTPQGGVFSNLNKFIRFYRETFNNKLKINPALQKQNPVCIKPAAYSRGRGVTPCVVDDADLLSAWYQARRFSERIVLERSVTGRNIRIMLLGGHAHGAYECLPVTVIGNGHDSLAGLIKARTQRRSSNPWLSQWSISKKEALALSGLSLDAIPEKGKLITLSNVASIRSASDIVAVTDRIHPSLLQLAEQAVNCFPGLHLACVSLICDDPERERAHQTLFVIDIDSKPDIASLAFPSSGQGEDIADELLDYAMQLERHQRQAGPLPCILPAPPFSPPTDKAFALDSRVEGQLLRHAARSLGYQTQKISPKLTRIARHQDEILFYKSISPGTRVVARRATSNNKAWTKQLLRNAALPTPSVKTFEPDDRAKAWDYAHGRGIACVVKPRSGSWGRGVTTRIVDPEHFNEAWERAVQTKTKTILVEEYAPGNLYRLFVIGHHLVATAEILPPLIVGDGQKSVKELIKAQNAWRERDPCLAQCPIKLGPIALRYLQDQGLTQDSIPEAGRQIRLDTVANTGIGGTCRDVTDEVHPGFAPIAAKARKAVFDPPHVGIDLVADDIARPPDEQFWSIIEVNTNPDLSLHYFPTDGQARDVANSLLTFLFEAQTRRILC